MGINVDGLIDTGINLAKAIGSIILDVEPRDLIDVIGVEDHETLTVKGFGYLTLFNISGYYGSVGTEEFKKAKTVFYDSLKNRLTEDSSHLVKFYFESDPDGAAEVFDANFAPIRSYLKSCNLELDDLLDEKRDANLPYTQKESCFFGFYSMPSKSSEYSVEDTAGKGVGDSNVGFEAEKLLLNHKSIVESLNNSLSDVLNISKVSADSVIAEIYRCINGKLHNKRR